MLETLLFPTLPLPVKPQTVAPPVAIVKELEDFPIADPIIEAIDISQPIIIEVGYTPLQPLKQLELAEVPEIELKPVETPAVSVGVNISIGGNGYSRGYCTHWVSQRRAEVGKPIPSNWHDARQWLGYAKAQGYTASAVPTQYAIGARGNHVVFSESINADGTVNISEKNWTGWNKVSHRTVAPTAFTWIY
jgi:surface antigen